jgi:acylphosphatase
MIVCKRVLYSGRVQGVGFRYSTRHLAQGFPVAGFVRNLRSGQVEVHVEGEVEQVEAFLTELGRQMADYITSSRAQEEPPQGGTAFVIRY